MDITEETRSVAMAKKDDNLIPPETLELSQEKIYQILSQGIIVTMEDDLKKALQGQSMKVDLIPDKKKQKEQRLGQPLSFFSHKKVEPSIPSVPLSPAASGLGISSKGAKPEPEEGKEKTVPAVILGQALPPLEEKEVVEQEMLSQPQPELGAGKEREMESQLKSTAGEQKESVKEVSSSDLGKSRPNEPEVHREQEMSVSEEKLAEAPKKEEPIIPKEPAPAKKKIIIQKGEIQQFRQKTHQEVLQLVRNLKALSQKAKPFQEERERIDILFQQQKAALDKITKREREIESQRRVVEKQESESQSPDAKHLFEKRRWQLEEQRRKIEEEKWTQEEEVEKMQLALGKIDIAFQEIATQEEEMTQRKKELEDILTEIDLRVQEEEMQGKREQVEIEEKRLENEIRELQEKKNSLAAKIEAVRKQEQAIEQENKEIEEQEKNIHQPRERRKLEQERWQVEEKRKIQEKQRWALEQEFSEQENNLNSLQKQYQQFLQQNKQWEESIQKIRNQAKYILEFAEEMPPGIKPVGTKEGLVREPAIQLTKEKQIVASPEQEEKKAVTEIRLQARVREKEEVSEQLKAKIGQEKERMVLQTREFEEKEERERKIKEIQQRAEQERQSRDQSKLKGPLSKEEILRRLTQVSPEEELARQDFLARVGGAKKLTVTKPKKAEDGVVFHPMIRRISSAEKVFHRILIIVLAIVVAGGVYFFVHFAWTGKSPIQLGPVKPETEQGQETSSGATTTQPSPGQPLATSAPETGQPSSGEEAEVIKPAPMPPTSLIKGSSAIVLQFSTTTEISSLLSNTLKENFATGTFIQILFFVPQTNSFLKPAEIFRALQAEFPVELDSQTGTSTLFVYSSASGNRLGLVAQSAEVDDLKTGFRAWEGTAETKTANLFSLLGKTGPAIARFFRVSTYQGVVVRYQTFSKQDLGICYGFYNNYFVFTASWEAMARIIDNLKTPRSD